MSNVVAFERDRRVSVFQDTTLVFPELWADVYIAGSPYEQNQFAEMFVRARCKKADSPAEADIVIFTGGPDVDPTLYGEIAHHSTRIDTHRDQADLELYGDCFEKGIPMVGICRGAQFLHVMNGGKLYQDVDGHYGDHPIYDVKTQRMVPKTSSTHHQMVIRQEGMEVLAESPKARNRWCNPTRNVEGMKQDVEAFFYPDTCVLGIQGHPEYRGYHQFTKWSLDLILEYIIMNKDVALVKDEGKTVRRLKSEFIAERNKRWAEEIKNTYQATAN